jgi:hypothetical protein
MYEIFAYYKPFSLNKPLLYDKTVKVLRSKFLIQTINEKAPYNLFNLVPFSYFSFSQLFCHYLSNTLILLHRHHTH